MAAAFSALILAPLYSAINAWSLSYFFKSFYSVPLWSRCKNVWNTDDCIQNTSLVSGLLSNLMNTTVPSDSTSPYIDTEFDEPDNSTHEAINSTVADNSSVVNDPYANETRLLHATQQYFE